MTNTKLKLGLATLLVAGTASTLVIQHQSQARLREENQSFRQQIARLSSDLESLTNTATLATNPGSLSGDQRQELLRLRGEIGVLRQETNELAKLREENRNLLSRLAQQSEADTNQVSSEDQFILRQTHVSTTMRTLLWAIKDYASAHGGQYPASFDQLTASGSLQSTNFPGNLGLADFQIENERLPNEAGNFRTILSLRDPILRPGLPSVSIFGEISDAGVIRTRVMNVSP